MSYETPPSVVRWLLVFGLPRWRADRARRRSVLGLGLGLGLELGLGLGLGLGLACVGGCSSSYFRPPAVGERIALYDHAAVATTPPITALGLAQAPRRGSWRFLRRARGSITYLYEPKDSERASHKLYVTLFDAPTPAWERLPSQLLFAEMTKSSRLLVLDILPDEELHGSLVKRGLLTLLRPGDREPTVLTVACAQPPRQTRGEALVVCAMLEETQPNQQPAPTDKAGLQRRMLAIAERLTGWLSRSRVRKRSG